MICEYNGMRPRVGKNVFIASTAVVLGDVEIEDGSSIWYNAVLRGDQEHIHVGRNTNIQDNCTVHIDRGFPVGIGDNVIVGHNAVIHGCTIEDDCLIGIGAIVLNDAQIKSGSIVAAGSVVKTSQVIGPRHLVVGSPAVLKKMLSDDVIDEIRKNAHTYCILAEGHRRIKGL